MTAAPVSWTEIETFRQCPHKHQLHYKEGWRPPKLGFHLRRGILWHEVLDLHYHGVKNTGDVRDPGTGALNQIIELFNAYGAKDPEHPEHDIGSVCLWMYHGYRRWAPAQDAGFRIVASEIEFSIELPNGMTLTGRVDLVIEYRGHLWLIDHKAVSTLPSGKEIDLDDQTPLYIWAMRQLGYEVRGAWLGYTRAKPLKTRTLQPGERFKRTMVYRTDYELEVVVEEAMASMEGAYSPLNRHQRHPNPDTCKWKCPFTDACIGGRRGEHLEREILLSSGFRQSGRRKTHLTVVEDTSP